jgi:hypothetical protein
MYLTKHHAVKTYWESGGIAPCFLDLGTRWKWVVSFTPWPLYPSGKDPLVPTGQEAGWAPELLWTRWWRENVAIYLSEIVFVFDWTRLELNSAAPFQKVCEAIWNVCVCVCSARGWRQYVVMQDCLLSCFLIKFRWMFSTVLSKIENESGFWMS